MTDEKYEYSVLANGLPTGKYQSADQIRKAIPDIEDKQIVVTRTDGDWEDESE